jgi:phosphoglycolate phosphatase
MGSIEAVIFDFDFTLADSSAGAIDCVNYALRQMGLPEAEPSRICASIGLTRAESFEFVSGLRDSALAAQYADHFVDQADRVMADKTAIYDCVPPVLDQLRQRDLRLGVVSTKFRYRIEEVLGPQGLTEKFDVIVGGEDVTEHKPHPESLLLALDRLGCSADAVLYVGDHPVDANAARAAGTPFVAVLTGVSPAEVFQDFDLFATIGDLTELPRVLDSIT